MSDSDQPPWKHPFTLFGVGISTLFIMAWYLRIQQRREEPICSPTKQWYSDPELYERYEEEPDWVKMAGNKQEEPETMKTKKTEESKEKFQE
ncbi:uncharacterized protein LOC106663913 isoform X3 [Cimex lectularius]|uniref:Uncharacterized protein n=1 Tax=Cimex lectularius TaxID=79782 RepID=A0A8I6RJV8_CIMLE|nr:uncharacterized protein LOC106663913 isoform X3 [Cimex lectularius]